METSGIPLAISLFFMVQWFADCMPTEAGSSENKNRLEYIIEKRT